MPNENNYRVIFHRTVEGTLEFHEITTDRPETARIVLDALAEVEGVESPDNVIVTHRSVRTETVPAAEVGSRP